MGDLLDEELSKLLGTKVKLDIHTGEEPNSID